MGLPRPASTPDCTCHLVHRFPQLPRLTSIRAYFKLERWPEFHCHRNHEGADMDTLQRVCQVANITL